MFPVSARSAPQTELLTIIIVNWNARPYVLRCLESIRDAGIAGRVEVIVVDNGSRDGSPAAVRESFPSVQLIANTSNRGFAGGVNDGLKTCTGRLILVLNPDIVLGTGKLEPLIRYLEDHEDVAAVLPLLVDDEGSRQRGYVRRLPSIMHVLLFATELERWSRNRPNLVDRYLEHPVGDQASPVELEQVPGAFLLTRKSILDATKGLDEAFLLFYEDVDWCVRVRSLGYRLVLLPDIAVRHSGGRSLPEDFDGWLAARYLISMIRYFRIHHGRLSAWTVTAILVLNALVVVGRKVLLRPFMNIQARRTLALTARKQAGFLRHLLRKLVLGKEVTLPQ